MLADSKKVATLVNAAGLAVQKIRTEVSVLEDLRTKFNTHNPVVTGTPMEGNKAGLSASIDALRTEIDLAVWDSMVDGIVPSHSGRALD